MANHLQQPEQLKTALGLALSKPPAAVGRRLRSEPALSLALGVKRWQIRDALESFVKDGILAKKAGSGTYVQRIPRPEDLPEHSQVPAIPADTLFAQPREADPLSQLKRGKTKLQLLGYYTSSLSGQLSWSKQHWLAAMSRHADRLGYAVSAHEAVRSDGTYLPAQQIAELIGRSPAVGFIFDHTALDALLSAGVTIDRPWVGVSGMTTPQDHPASVFIDSDAAISSAVTILAKNGYKRIGFIALERAPKLNRLEVSVYEAAMQAAGLSYRAVTHATTGMMGSIKAAREMLERPEAPDAIYVADDFSFNGIAEVLAMKGITPGKDLGVISFANRGLPLAPGFNWSRLEADCELLGRMVVENLLYRVESRGDFPTRVAVQPTWCPGATHLRS